MCVPSISTSRRTLAIPSSALHQKRQETTTAVPPPPSPTSSIMLPIVIDDDFDSKSPSSTLTGKTNNSKGKGLSRLAHHDYHDHSQDAESSFVNKFHIPRGGVSMTFPIQLHAMLENIEREGYGHVISWQPHGRCFVIHNKKEFISHVMPVFMRQSKFPSFRRQLNLYGFQRITAGPDRGGYYHELFLRGKPFLAHHMQRQCIKGTRVRCRSNPEEEPNFYKMEPVNAISSVSDSEDESIEPLDCNSAPSYNDLECFAGMNFHMLDDDESVEMDSFLESVSKQDSNLPLAEDGDDENFGEILERVFCQ